MSFPRRSKGGEGGTIEAKIGRARLRGLLIEVTMARGLGDGTVTWRTYELSPAIKAYIRRNAKANQ
jgi:hypothetical protein